MKSIFVLVIICLLNSTAFSLSKVDREFEPTIELGDDVVNRRYYSLSYSHEHKQSEWVFYKLSKRMISGDAERKDGFIKDPEVFEGTASNLDYQNSGFDRGHLLPAADMKLSQKAMDETFFMSNVSPQDPRFNRQIWKKLEDKIREFATNKGTLFVYTGPVLEEGLPTIGNSEVSVPEKFYKIVVHKRGDKIETISFVMGNEKSERPLKDFIVSIDEIEHLTGIDFLEKLPDEKEDWVESARALGNWNI